VDKERETRVIILEHYIYKVILLFTLIGIPLTENITAQKILMKRSTEKKPVPAENR
jgi:hypothetical protein